MSGRPAASRQERTQAQKLARQVRSLREARGWTRDRLAKEAGIHSRTLMRLENAGATQPGFFTIGALAAALEVSLDGLFRAARPEPGLWSIGYEGRDIDSFIAALASERIDTVADVRLTPISRKPGFSKTRLQTALGTAGIEYVHLRALGNPKDNRAPFWEGRLAEGRARFATVLRSEAAAAQLNALAELARISRVAVLCYERDADHCHRALVLEKVATHVGREVTVLV
ncbi:DUF488 family protein [Streptomyces ochraceiscleroticus]|uniref:DUF488 family protein n=1 Tax=Streptomyces ochraceiscleroticus TaxID=47761 RepID=A0ABW1MRC6_9ACTN|nr:DUF488 family protein [Streptomyces ochraceiscleroticus]